MKSKRNIFIAFILNLFLSIFELIGGFISGSVAISSDAVHDLADAISIGLSYFLEKTSDKKPNAKFTYGYVRFSVLGGFITTLTLLISSGVIIYNAILRIIFPVSINYNGMLSFAVVGLIVNLTATYFTHGGKSINQKAVNLHMLEDVFGWLIVLIGAVIMRFTSLYVLDPILSIIVALFILINSGKNIKEIFDIFLIKTPKNIDVNEITHHVKSLKNVIDVHHVHVWTLDGQINCATLHVVITNYSEKVKSQIKNELKEHGIMHTTIEIETQSEDCKDTACNIKMEHNSCHHHHR